MNIPPFFCKMRELSVFVDESGDFGEATVFPSHYIVTFVFHDQSNCIDQQVSKLEASIQEAGFTIEYIHTGPIIRREGVFKDYSLDDRRKLIYRILNFTLSCPVKCFSIIIDRKEARDKISLSGKLAKGISNMISSHQEFFLSFDRVIVYYDNGQHELSVILNAIFTLLLSSVEFRNASPQTYRLLQSADFICTMELLKVKQRLSCLSQSEQKVFFKPQELKKTFFNAIAKLYLDGKQ